MTGIDFVDTIVVRRSIEKGTKTIKENLKPSPWAGKSFRESQKDRLEKAGNPNLVSGKGTKRILPSSMHVPPIPNTIGRFIVTGKGTGRIQLGS